MPSGTSHTGSSLPQLRPYQTEGVSWLLDHPRGLLADPMGVGKTVQAVAALRALKPQTGIIVAPKTVLPSWVRHLKEWWPKYLGRPRGWILQGQPRERRSRILEWQAYGGILLLNYELLKDLEGALRPIDFVIFDEAHRVRGRKTKTHRRAKQWARQADYVWMLTGTPIVRGPEDLVALRYVLTGGREPYWKLIDRYFITEPNFWGGINVAGVANPEYFRAWLSEWVLRRDKRDVLPGLPELVRIPVDIQLHPHVRDMYRQLEEELYLAIEDGFDIAVATHLAAATKLRQLLQSPKNLHPSLPLGDDIRWLQDFIEDTSPPVVIYSPFKSSLHLLDQVLGAEKMSILTGDVTGTERQIIIERFNRGQIPVLGVSIQMAEGFELPAARAVVFWGFDWNSTTHEQAEARVHRIGFSEDFLPVYYLRHPNTIDERIVDVVNKKYTWQQVLLARRPSQRLDSTKENPL